MLAKETVCEIVELNEFKHRMFNLHRSAPYHTYRELYNAKNDISEKISLIKDFLRLKDKHWSLEMAYAGVEFSKGEQYKQLRACGTQYVSYYRTLTDLLIIKENISQYIEKKYTRSMINKSKAKDVIEDLQALMESAEQLGYTGEQITCKNAISLLHDIMGSTEE